jgi:DNA-binding GntR family transcriptional regulator
MNLDQIQRIEQRTLKENVTDVLRTSIIAGELAPGTEINQVGIANQLGVSRGPVREALSQLEQEGLVHSIPYKGVFVTSLTRRYVEELYSVRMALEMLAVERAIERITEKDLAELNRVVQEMRIAAKAGDLQRLLQVDLEFHEHLVVVADHELLYKLWRQVEFGVLRCLRTRHQIYTFLDEVVGSHPTIVMALTDRNKEWAIEIMREHIRESEDHILANWPSLDGESELPLDDQLGVNENAIFDGEINTTNHGT